MPQSKPLMLKIIYIVCFGLVFSEAYDISGRVVDSKTNEPIENVNIYIEDSNLGTTTNQDGFFVLYLNEQLENNIILHIKRIGYEEQIQTLELLKSNLNLGELFLVLESLELESVHIHSHSHSQNQISTISLAGQKLNDNLTGNIATTLSNQPNIGVNSFGNITSKPVLRGYSGDRFLLTKDGNKIGDLSQSSIDHVITLDMSEVNEIEIIRGPKSLVYGSNTIGGVIHTSVNGNPTVRVNRFFKKFLVGGESFNKGFYGNGVFYIPIRDNQINIVFSNRETKNQSSPTKELKNTYSKISNYKLGFTRYNKNSYINFMIENYKMDYGIPPSLEGHINGVDIKLIKKTFQINYHQDLSFYNFNQLDIKYNFIDYGHEEFENNIDYFSVALSKNTHDFKIQLQSFNSIIGSELNYKQFVPKGFYWTPITNEVDISLYGFNENKFNNFDLLSSFRIGYLSIEPSSENIGFSNIDENEVKDRSFKYFSSSIGLRKIIHNFELNGWLMNTMRGPRVEELYSDGPHLGSYSYEIGEPKLQLEKIYGFESSAKYNGDPLKLSLTTFYNYSPYYYQMSKLGECKEEFVVGESHPCAGVDFIEWGSGSAGWLYKYRTEGVKSSIKGLELNLSYVYENFKIIYDFSLVRGKDLTNDTYLSYINPDKQIIILKYENKSFDYQLRLAKIHAQNRLGEFESYTQSSFLVDFIVSYNRKNQNMTIQFNNIFNTEHYNHLSKIKSIMPEPGRNVMLSYKIFF